jgi:hypothetical protein
MSQVTTASKLTTARASGYYFRRISLVCSSALLAASLLAICPRPASASGFNPLLDEFWIVKNGSQLFRDSFDNTTAPPPHGPDDSNPNSTGITYNTSGDAAFTGESGGKLTIDPSLGSPSLGINFVQAIRRFSGADGFPSSLNQASSFEIHALLDISDPSLNLPTLPGDFFGIRATDQGLGGPSNDRATLRVVADGLGGINIVFLDQDFTVPSSPVSNMVDSASISSVLGLTSLELILSKDADSANVTASYKLNGGAANNLSGSVTIYDGELVTRAEFDAGSATVTPLPAALPLFASGAGVLGFVGWRRKKKTAKAVA